MGFTLHFHFGENEFFTNTVLTKTYELKCEPQEDDPFSFEVWNYDSVESQIPIRIYTHRVLKSSNALDVKLIGRKARI